MGARRKAKRGEEVEAEGVGCSKSVVGQRQSGGGERRALHDHRRESGSPRDRARGPWTCCVAARKRREQSVKEKKAR